MKTCENLGGGNLGRVGTIGRFRPLHNGSALMLDSICSQSEHVIIGIGSAEGIDKLTGIKIPPKYNARNPFTPNEVKDMIELYLKERHSNYEIMMVPDFGHLPDYSDGSRWRDYVVEHYGRLDHFITGNQYTAELLKNEYDIIHPASLIRKEDQAYMRGSIVRMTMAIGQDYRPYVPGCVADYLERNGLVERFRREFGLETLAGLGSEDWLLREDLGKEMAHAREK